MLELALTLLTYTAAFTLCCIGLGCLASVYFYFVIEKYINQPRK